MSARAKFLNGKQDVANLDTLYPGYIMNPDSSESTVLDKAARWKGICTLRVLSHQIYLDNAY